MLLPKTALGSPWLVMAPVWLVGILGFFALLVMLFPIQLVRWVVGHNEFRDTLPCAPIIDAGIRADAWIDDFRYRRADPQQDVGATRQSDSPRLSIQGRRPRRRQLREEARRPSRAVGDRTPDLWSAILHRRQ